MFWWLDRWGLTPAQVRELPVKHRDRLPHIAEMVDKLRADEQRRQSRG